MPPLLTIDIAALLELAAWCRQRLDLTHGGSACPTAPPPLPPPRRKAAPATTESLTLWAHLPAERQRQLQQLLGRLLARLLEAQRLKEADHD